MVTGGRHRSSTELGTSSNRLVKPYQSVGAFGPRDFDKYVWLAPIPRYDPNKSEHRQLVDLAAEGEAIAVEVEVEGIESFQTARRLIRRKLSNAGIEAALDAAVRQLLGG